MNTWEYESDYRSQIQIFIVDLFVFSGKKVEQTVDVDSLIRCEQNKIDNVISETNNWKENWRHKNNFLSRDNIGIHKTYETTPRIYIKYDTDRESKAKQNTRPSVLFCWMFEVI